MGNGLSPLSTAAAGASDVRNVSIKRKSLSPIFSVRSCTSSALSRLLSLSWSYSTLVGVGVCLPCPCTQCADLVNVRSL